MVFVLSVLVPGRESRDKALIRCGGAGGGGAPRRPQGPSRLGNLEVCAQGRWVQRAVCGNPGRRVRALNECVGAGDTLCPLGQLLGRALGLQVSYTHICQSPNSPRDPLKPRDSRLPTRKPGSELSSTPSRKIREIRFQNSFCSCSLSGFSHSHLAMFLRSR